MPGSALRMRAAIGSNSCLARSRSAARGISSISCAIADCFSDGSATLMGKFIDCGADIPAVPVQQIRCVRPRKTKAEQDGELHVACALLHLTRGLSGRA